MKFTTQTTQALVLSLLISAPLFSIRAEQAPDVLLTDGETALQEEKVTQEECALQNPSLHTKEAKPPVILDYKDPLSLMQDFIDLTKKPQTKIQYWATQLAELLKKDAKLKAFGEKVLEKAEKEKNPVLRTQAIKQLFLDYQNKFSVELRNYILANFARVRTALDRRIAKA